MATGRVLGTVIEKENDRGIWKVNAMANDLVLKLSAYAMGHEMAIGLASTSLAYATGHGMANEKENQKLEHPWVYALVTGKGMTLAPPYMHRGVDNTNRILQLQTQTTMNSWVLLYVLPSPVTH